MAQPNLDFLPLLPTTPVLPSAAAPRRALGSLRPCSARLAAAFGRVAEFVLHRGHRDITRVTLAGADCDARRCLCTAARALHLALSRDTLPFPVHPPFLHRRPLPAYGFDSRPRRISHRRCPFFPSFFLSFLPSFSRVSLRVSLLPRPTVLSVYRAGVGSAARLALSYSLSLSRLYGMRVPLPSSQTFRRPYAPSSGYHANPPSGSFEFRRLPRDSKMEESIFRGMGKID